MKQTQNTKATTDDIYWIHSQLRNRNFFFFYTEPFFHQTKDGVPAKLIYSSIKPYGINSIKRNILRRTMYRVAYRMNDQKITHISDYEIQQAARRFGFFEGKGLHANLSVIQNENISNITPSVQFSERFPCSTGHKAADIIAKEYNISSDDLKLTGGAQLNASDINEQHDLDVVIPVTSYEHAGEIWNKMCFRSDKFVVERGFKSPMRWLLFNNTLIVCPFFIYSKMEIPIIDMKIGPIVEKNVTITDSRFSFFNMPLFEVNGGPDFVAFRSRIVRSAITENTSLQVKARTVQVTNGNWKGRCGILITDPFREVGNLDQVLRRWNA